MSIPLNIPSNAVRGPRFSRRSTSGTCAAGSISIPSRHSNTSRRSTHDDLPMQFQLQDNFTCQRSSVMMPPSAVAAPEAVVEAEVCTSSSSWPSFPKYFEWGEMLGAGSFGKVRVATDTRSKQQYAVKILPKRIEGRGDRTRNIEDEVSARCDLAHPSNLVHLHVGMTCAA
jgi:serine/threonine protein kinase